MAEPKLILGTVVGAVAGAVLAIAAVNLTNRVDPAPIIIESPVPTQLPTTQPTAAPIRVHVSGGVIRPDVYELPPGSIVRDAVQAAGGFAPDADASSVNLAQPLQDGIQIWVPSMAATVERALVMTPAPTQPIVVPGAPTVSTTIVQVNINTAGEGLLQGLPGIGPVLAAEIVAFRQANGEFASIEAIQDVPGIGPGRFEQIKALITTQ